MPLTVQKDRKMRVVAAVCAVFLRALTGYGRKNG
jgi:hypothetical protein